MTILVLSSKELKKFSMKRRNLHFHESLYTFWDQQRPKLASTWRQHQIGPYWMIRKIELHSTAVDQCAKNLSKIEILLLIVINCPLK